MVSDESGVEGQLMFLSWIPDRIRLDLLRSKGPASHRLVRGQQQRSRAHEGGGEEKQLPRASLPKLKLGSSM